MIEEGVKVKLNVCVPVVGGGMILEIFVCGATPGCDSAPPTKLPDNVNAPVRIFRLASFNSRYVLPLASIIPVTTTDTDVPSVNFSVTVP